VNRQSLFYEDSHVDLRMFFHARPRGSHRFRKASAAATLEKVINSIMSTDPEYARVLSAKHMLRTLSQTYLILLGEVC